MAQTQELIPNRPLALYYLLTALLCGALIMVIEVLGSRVVGPFFGVSLFVWTSLITVTMIALAAGYGVGGMLSDRLNHPRHLFTLIIVAGVLTLLVPAIKGIVLKSSMPLGLRGGSFVSTLLLFGPPLFLLGCVSPFLVRMLAREMHNIGRLVGGLYALSTVGSVVGTVLSGFVLIAYLGVDQIFALTGLLLLVLGIGYFVLFQRRWYSIALLILPMVLWPSTNAISKVMPDGTKVQLLYQEDGYYGNVKVVDYSFQAKHIRELMIDGLIQGGVDVRTGESIYSYPYLLQFLPYLSNPGGKEALVIGLGAGIIPRWYQSRGVHVDVVDIDPTIFNVAKRYFGYQPNGDSIVSDARYFLSNTTRKYDFMVLDAFNGDITPGHLISIEALRLARQRLTPSGILSINLIGSLKQQTFITASVIHTLRQVFDQVQLIPTFDPNDPRTEGSGNLIILAYQGAARNLPLTQAKQLSVNPLAYQEVQTALNAPFSFPSGTPAMVLTDNFNPVDFHDVWLREAVRGHILSEVDWDILIE